MTELRRSPLDAAHRALGAKMMAFGGWDMPLAYPSGTLTEHRACREDAVVFDASHLGTVRVEGSEAVSALQGAFTNDLHRIGPGRAQYTHLLDEGDGSILDDIIVWWIDEHHLEVMPNASNTERVVAALGPAAVDVTGERALLALQGPNARHLLHQVWPEAAMVGRFRVATIARDGLVCRVAGTGYTGEDGVEVTVPVEGASGLWEELLEIGFEPAGLGARDTLRLEAGLPLHGNELGPGVTPLQAGLGWVVAWDKGPFPGRAALEAEREAGVRRRLRALLLDGRRPPRSGQAITLDHAPIGEVTSGNFSPILERGIALGFVDPKIAVGDRVAIDSRGRELPAVVVDPPFVQPGEPRPI